jgi:hypothetical protein
MATKNELLGSGIVILKNASRVLNSEKIICPPTLTLTLKFNINSNYKYLNLIVAHVHGFPTNII